MIRNFFVLTASMVIAASFPVSGQADIDGAYDHPEIPRMAGSNIVYFDRTEYDRVEIPLGPINRDQVIEDTETVEGEVLTMTYALDNPDISTLQMKRNYRRALEERGFDILYAASNRELQTERNYFRFINHDIFDRSAGPRRLDRDRDLRYLAARSPDGEVMASILAFQARSGPAVLVTVVTDDEMDTQMDHQPLTVSEMEAGLMADGRVAVQDILFEFDSARILPQSSESLATVAELLSDAAGMALLVVGHTDNSGSYDYNLSLSMARAQAVVDYLIGQHSVAGDRLQAAGAGMMAPIASNRTDEGRALNRRVELVEMQH